MKTTVVVSGSGGQGIMSIGTMLAQTAVSDGREATFLPEYGPEQRGGSAKCTVVIDDREIISPLAKKCDVFIAMNEQGYKKFIADLKADGILVYNSSRVTSEIKRTDITAVPVPADDICTELGSMKCANIVMIGALTAVSDIVTKDGFASHIEEKFAAKNPGLFKTDIEALEKGAEYGKKINS